MQAEQEKEVELFYRITTKKNAESINVSPTAKISGIKSLILKRESQSYGVSDVGTSFDSAFDDKFDLTTGTTAEEISKVQTKFLDKQQQKKQQHYNQCALQVDYPPTQQQQQVQISDQLFFGNIKKAFKEAIKEEAEEGSMLSFSRVSVGDYNKILSRYGITVDVYKDIIVGTSDCYGFTWSGSKEDAQSGPYKNWINEHLVHKQRGLFVKTTSSKGQYLKFKGQIGDVVITISNVEEAILQYACVILELKKQISGLEHHYQAICELLGAASVSNVAFSPILVLTDLNEEWKFYFFTERKKVKMVHIIGLMTATNLIRAICQYRVGKDVSNTGVGDLSTFSAEIKNNFHLAVPDYNPVVDITTSHNDEDCHMFELFTEEEKREIFRRDVHETYQHWMSIYS